MIIFISMHHMHCTHKAMSILTGVYLRKQYEKSMFLILTFEETQIHGTPVKLVVIGMDKTRACIPFTQSLI